MGSRTPAGSGRAQGEVSLCPGSSAARATVRFGLSYILADMNQPRDSPPLSLPLLLALFFPLSPVLFDYTSKTSALLELNIWLFSQSFCPFCNFSTILGST